MVAEAVEEAFSEPRRPPTSRRCSGSCARAAGRFVNERTRRRPMIVPVVMEALSDRRMPSCLRWRRCGASSSRSCGADRSWRRGRLFARSSRQAVHAVGAGGRVGGAAGEVPLCSSSMTAASSSIHLGMTGQLRLRPDGETDPYVRAWWALEDGRILELRDVRVRGPTLRTRSQFPMFSLRRIPRPYRSPFMTAAAFPRI